MAAPEQLTQGTAVGAIFSFQLRLASLAGDVEAFASRLLPADDDGGSGRATMLEASCHARRALGTLTSAMAPVVAELGGGGGIAGEGTGGEGTGAGGGGDGGGGGATTEAAALRATSAEQEKPQGGERSVEREEPPARKRARVAAGTGATATAAAAAAAVATAAQPPPSDAAPRATALFSSPSSSSETSAPSSSTSSDEDDADGGENIGGDGAGEGATGGGGEGQDDGFVFASQPATKFLISRRIIDFHLPVVRELRLNEGAPDSVQRGTRGAASRSESYRFAVFALRSAPARRRGSSSWEPTARGAPGAQAFESDVVAYTGSERSGARTTHSLVPSDPCLQSRGDRGVAGAAREWALRDAEVGDELVFARRGTDRELFIWLEKKTQG